MWNLKLKRKVELIEMESRMMVTRGWELGRWADAGQRAQAFSYKMNKFWGSNDSTVIIVHTVLYP